MHPCSFNDLFTIFIAKSRTQNTFKGLKNEATFSWNGLLPTFIGERKTKINLFTSFFFWSILALTLLYLFTTRIYFEREQYRNPVLNSTTYLYIYIYDIFPTGTRYFLLKLLFFFLFLTSPLTV